MGFYLFVPIWAVIVLYISFYRFDNKNTAAIVAASWSVAVFFGSFYLPCVWASACLRPSPASIVAATALQAALSYAYLRIAVVFSGKYSTYIAFQLAVGVVLFYILLVFFSYFPAL